MFKCERCGSGYNGTYVGVENCPRCQLLDRVQSPLSFEMFKTGQSSSTPQGRALAQDDAGAPTSRRSARSAT